MNKTVKELISKIQETTQEIDQVKQDVNIALLVINEQHRVRTRRDDR
ncbi:hypothetical protein [Weissella cibaria]|nr:hypothetical protein [Weissella cibaria]